jgi:superfamily II DNA or RNA helicase
MDKPKITGNIIEHWLKYASDKKTIMFAPTVEKSIKFTQLFNDAGIPWVHLDAKTNKQERREVLQDFARGKYKGVSNVALFTEGFDIAANSGMDVRVGCVIDAAPSRSLGVVMQRWGRGLRRQDGVAIILDHAGNGGPNGHGMPCLDRDWKLETGSKQPKRDQEQEIQIKQCPKCFAVHKPAPICSECGHVYEVKPHKIEEVDAMLVELTPEQMQAKQDRMAHGMATGIEGLMLLGHSRDRAIHIIEARQVKAALQQELFNLSVAAGKKPSLYQIRKLKPKQLKTEIAELKEALNVHS